MKTVTNRSHAKAQTIKIGGKEHSYRKYGWGLHHPTYGPLKDEQFNSKAEMKAAMEKHPHYNPKLQEENLGEEIKGWKHAGRDLNKARRQQAEMSRNVKLVRLKKNGDESKLHDATSRYNSEDEARQKHAYWVKVNPGKGIAHNLYVDGKHVETLKEGVLKKIFGKKDTRPAVEHPKERFPNSNKANEWMSQKVAHYERHKPNELHHLFSPASGDYMPLSVHVGSSWKKEHEDHYNELKKKHPEAVAKAKEMTTGIAGRVSLSRVGPHADFHGMSIHEDAPSNAVGGGNIAGMGVGAKGEPGVSPKAMDKYKRKNKQEAPRKVMGFMDFAKR